MKSRLRSELASGTQKADLLTKIKALYDQRSSRLSFEIGGNRFNAAVCGDVAIDLEADYNNFTFQRPNASLAGGGKEETYVTAVAEAGSKEVLTVTTEADDTGSLNSTYFTFKAKDSGGATETGYYVWLNINAAGVDPAVASHTGIEVAEATDATADAIATAMRAAITSVAGSKVVVTGATDQVIVTNKFMGNATNAADGAAPTGFTLANTAGVASTLLNKYFTLKSAEDETSFYVWFNVNSEGVAPAPGGTAIEVAVAIGASAATNATATAAAIDAETDFVSSVVSGAQFKIVNAAAGYSADVAAGDSTFTVSKKGELESYDLADIIMIKRLRNKKWLIVFADAANAAHDAS